MKCPLETGEVSELLAYATLTEDARRASSLDEHIAGCAACRDFAAGQQAVWKALDSWQAPPVADNFDRRIYERIAQQPSWPDRVMGILRPLVGWPAIPVAATASLLLAVGFLMERPAPPLVAPRPNAAQIQILQPEQVEHALDDMEMLREFTRAVPPSGGDSEI